MRAIVMFMATCVCIAGCERNAQPDRKAAIVVVDDAGHTVQLAKPAARVVSLLPTVTDLIVAMGQQQRLIARTDYDTDTALAHLPSVGGGLTPSLEWLAGHKPDLVISWPDRGTRSLVTQLQTLGIPVFGMAADTIANTYAAIKKLGILFDAAHSADSLITTMQSQLDSIRRSVANLRRVRVAYVVSLSPPSIVGPHTFIDELITVAGGANVFNDISKQYTEVSLEEIIRRDPDVIIVAREEPFDAHAELARLPGWKDLRASRSGHVYGVSANEFNRSGPEMPAATATLAQLFAKAR